MNMKLFFIIACLFITGCVEEQSSDDATKRNANAIGQADIVVKGHDVVYISHWRQAAAVHIMTECSHKDCQKFQKLLEKYD